MDANIDTIKTFRELLEWVTYDLDHNYKLNRDDKGNFYVNKLYITPTHLTYKTECAEILPDLFDKLIILYVLLKEDYEQEQD